MKNMTKVIMAGVLAVGTLAAGCQTTPTVTTPVEQTVTSNILQSYNWQLVDAKGTNNTKVPQLFFDPSNPLILEFTSENGNNFVSLLNTCNNMAAGYSIVNGNVQVGNIRSTRMACPEPQASFDKAAVDTVKGKYSISKSANNSPVLTITNAYQVASFKAIAK
ncbi:META domain-containing protein [Psychrobacter urativorans]|uniref:DUF306 domain-containing protein n=1 Tax=Psychrobacter urativorans TaxID=45610 RepID=A0A0M4TH42_9GAMM|nr:META domain-containing protein [Psychrobacter urativorans]ALF60916.1 hypothetical protein AOC03_12050 [Psychrobacter urativorans]